MQVQSQRFLPCSSIRAVWKCPSLEEALKVRDPWGHYMFVRARERLFTVGWTVYCSEECCLAAVCKSIVVHALNSIWFISCYDYYLRLHVRLISLSQSGCDVLY